MQAWQAYQKLTYETQWKAEVDRIWDEYKEAWQAKHPGENPPKKRLTIMSDFMKEKYLEETDEMKEKCEKYRDPAFHDEATPGPVVKTNSVNAGYQRYVSRF